MKENSKILLRVDKSVCCCCGVATYKFVPNNLPSVHKNRCDLCVARIHNLDEYYLIGEETNEHYIRKKRT